MPGYETNYGTVVHAVSAQECVYSAYLSTSLLLLIFAFEFLMSCEQHVEVDSSLNCKMCTAAGVFTSEGSALCFELAGVSGSMSASF